MEPTITPTEQKPEIHITRLSFCVALVGIAYVLGQYVWTWLAITLWVIVAGYAFIVVWGIADALRDAKK